MDAMAIKAAPFIGTPVIGCITTSELNDLCGRAKDMDVLNRALNSDDTPSQGGDL